MPELPEVETVRRGLARWVAGRTSRRSRCGTRGRCAAMSPARTTSPPRWPAGPSPGSAGGASTCGLPLDSRDAVVGHLGHVRPDAAARARRPRPRPHLRIRFTLHRRRARSCASSTSARSAGWRCRRAGPTCPRRSRTSRWTRSTRHSIAAAFVAALRRRRTGVKRALLDQTLISGRRQHLRRRGAVAGGAAR